MSCGSNETDVVAIDCPSANQTDGPAELYYSTEEPTTLAGTTAETIYANVSEAANWTEMLTTASAIPATGSGGGFGAEVMIPLYSVIFILSIVGNILVIVTLTQNRRMRTVTNVFLLNLVS